MSVKLKLMNDWIRVRMDPDNKKTVSGTLFKPDGAHDTIMRTGLVLDVGPGPVAKKGDYYLDFNVPTGLKVGDGVLFNVVVATLTKTAEAVRQTVLAENECLIRPADVMLVFDYETRPRFE